MLKRLHALDPAIRAAAFRATSTGTRPENVVQEGDLVIGGPGGAPTDDDSVEERRERDRSDDAA